MTRVIVDRNAGLCAGVRRAIRGARRLLGHRSFGSPNAAGSPNASGSPNAAQAAAAAKSSQPPAGRDSWVVPARIISYGPLVHNREITDSLQREGLEIAETLGEIKKGDTIVVRSHGVSPAEEKQLRSLADGYGDFTCPRVKRVHELIREKRDQGYRIVIVGNLEHPEVRGHLGYAGDSGIVVSSPSDAARVDGKHKAAVFAQTTITPRAFEEVVRALGKRVPELSMHRTLCPFVLKRQRWVEEHAVKADAVLIIGGANSSNTRRLYEIARGAGPAFLATGASDLDIEKMLGFGTVAVSAGASTPDSTVKRVLDRLRRCGAEIEYG
jgi:(E)-4-hydroxy-3-methyl-but-2-enyl pyrophosphate reductase